MSWSSILPVVITPELLTYLVLLTPVFPFFRASYYHLCSQNLSLAVFCPPSAVPYVQQMHMPLAQCTRPSTIVLWSLFRMLMLLIRNTNLHQDCLSQLKTSFVLSHLCLFPHTARSIFTALGLSALPAWILPGQLKSCCPPLRKEEK